VRLRPVDNSGSAFWRNHATASGLAEYTPTTPAPNQIATVKLTLSGYSGAVSEGVYINLVAAPVYTWSRASTALPPFLKYGSAAVPCANPSRSSMHFQVTARGRRIVPGDCRIDYGPTRTTGSLRRVESAGARNVRDGLRSRFLAESTSSRANAKPT